MFAPRIRVSSLTSRACRRDGGDTSAWRRDGARCVFSDGCACIVSHHRGGLSLAIGRLNVVEVCLVIILHLGRDIVMRECLQIFMEAWDNGGTSMNSRKYLGGQSQWSRGCCEYSKFLCRTPLGDKKEWSRYCCSALRILTSL